MPLTPIVFTALSIELIVRIVGLTSPLDIRRCQRVCRRLCDIVTSDEYLQYILELDTCGYVAPVIPRLDLSYPDKIKVLRKQMQRRQRGELVELESIELLPKPVRWTYLVDGVLACGYATIPTIGLARAIRFDKLPSTNKGTGHRHWYHDIGFNLWGFAMQPEWDFMVYLEAKEDRHYRLNFRTMSTNEPHPAAAASLLTGAAHDLVLTGDSSDRGFVLQAFGDLVGIMYRYSTQVGQSSVLVIFDWVNGAELVHLEVPLQSPSFCFLSPEHVLIPRPASPTYTDNSDTNEAFSTLGGLDVYQFHRHKYAHQAQAEAPRHVATFVLPDLRVEQNTLSVKAYTSSLPRLSTFYEQTWAKYPSRIYETPPKHHLLCIHIRTLIIPPDDDLMDWVESAGTLLVSSDPLLNRIEQTIGSSAGAAGVDDAVPIPWEAWGGDTAWLGSIAGEFSCPWSTDGLWAVTLQPTVDSQQEDIDTGVDLLVVDLNRARLRAHLAVAGEHHNSTPPQAQGRAPTRAQPNGVLEQAFSNPVDAVPRPAMKTLTVMRPRAELSEGMKVFADGENGESR